MKLKYKILFIIILFFTLFLFNIDTVNAANSDLLIAWIEENKSALADVLSGYDYLIVNNYYQSKVGLYYSSDSNHIFKVESSGAVNNGRRNLNSTSDWGDNHFEMIVLNPNSTNEFVIPTKENFKTEYGSMNNPYNILNNYYASNLKYASKPIYVDGVLTVLPSLRNEFELSSINFTESTSLNPLTLETNFFDYENISNYRLYVSYENTNNFVESGNIATYTDVQNNKTYFYFTYLPNKNGIYYFRLYNQSTDEWSNTYTFTFEGVDIDSDVSPNIEIPNFYIEKGDNSFILKTQWLDINLRDSLHLFYSQGNNIFYDCVGENLSTVTYTDNEGVTYFRYEYIVYEEGIYYFKFLDIEENLSSLPVQLNLSFDEDYSDTLISQPNYDLVPSLDYTLSFEEYDKVIIYSQWFDMQYKDIYKLYLHNNISGFEDTYSEIEVNGNLWRFKYTATENRVYHFRIYQNMNNLSFHSSTVSITVTLIGSQSYLDFVLDRLFTLYENSFGFLTYPFTFFFDLCNRFLNIEFKEPIIDIPDIYVPLYEDSPPLISATTINFNEIIESNSIFKTIHNLTLICTDAFIIFGLINLFKKKWNEVFK